MGCDNGTSSDQSDGGDQPVAADLKGALDIDGSTTVYPIVQIIGEDFGDANQGVKVSVNKSGTGSGFKKFLAGDLDIVTASRPIKESEDKEAADKKIDYLEIPIAYDGVSIIVNPANTFLKDVEPAQLKAMFAENSKVVNWSDVNPAWPKEKIDFYGPTDNHGTYEYFQEAILGKGKNFRKDYQPNQEYNAIVQAVAQDKNGIAYVGYNYYAENKGKVTAVTVHGVAPTEDTIKDGTYVPLSRPLFIYVKKAAMDRPEVQQFVDYALGDGGAAAVKDAKYVELPADVMAKVKERVADGQTGSVFLDATPGMKIADVLDRESK